jgi:hypothetical protein
VDCGKALAAAIILLLLAAIAFTFLEARNEFKIKGFKFWRLGSYALLAAFALPPIIAAKGGSWRFLRAYGWIIGPLFFVAAAEMIIVSIQMAPVPGCSMPKSCTLPAGLSCYEYSIDAEGNIELEIGQALGKGITVTGLGCSDRDASPPSERVNPVAIGNGGHRYVSGGESGNSLNCCTPGEPCRARLAVEYVLEGQANGSTVAYGDVSGNGEEAG